MYIYSVLNDALMVNKKWQRYITYRMYNIKKDLKMQGYAGVQLLFTTDVLVGVWVDQIN